MSLTKKEAEIIKQGKAVGKNQFEITRALNRYRQSEEYLKSPEARIKKVGQDTAKAQRIESRSLRQEERKKRRETGDTFFATTDIADIPSDLRDLGADIRATGQTERAIFSSNVERRKEDGFSPFDVTRNVRDFGVGVLSSGVNTIGNIILFGAKALTTPKQEEKISKSAKESITAITETEAARAVFDKVEHIRQNNPELYSSLRAAYVMGEAGAELFGLKFVTDALVKGLGEAGERLAIQTERTIRDEIGDILISPNKNNFDDIVEEGSRKLDVKSVTGVTEFDVDLSFREKMIGLPQDIKLEIQRNPDLTIKYFNIADARNKTARLSDGTVVWSPYGYGGEMANQTVQRLDEMLRDTGSVIGSTRQRLSTIQADIDSVARIESKFNSELDKLNLSIRNGVISQKRGTIDKLGSNSDLAVLQKFYDSLRIVKQNPSLTNLIDFRTSLDAKVKYGKEAREVSSSVDGVSRIMRHEVADVAAQIVGPTEAAKLKEFSDLMDIYTEMKSFTDRRAGGEYLLRLVLSGRGDEARQLVETVRIHTGTDLFAHAQMMTLATDIVGNAQQKNLFRQEVSKAGLDVTRALITADPKGLVGSMMQYVGSRLLNEEKIIREVAENAKQIRESNQFIQQGLLPAPNEETIRSFLDTLELDDTTI